MRVKTWFKRIRASFISRHPAFHAYSDHRWLLFMSLAGHLPKMSGSVSEISEPLRLPSSPARACLRTGSTISMSRFIGGFTVSRYTYRGDPITVLLSAVHGKYIQASVNEAWLRSLKTTRFVPRPMTSILRLFYGLPSFPLIPIAVRILSYIRRRLVHRIVVRWPGAKHQLHVGLFLLGEIVRESCACMHASMLSAPPL